MRFCCEGDTADCFHFGTIAQAELYTYLIIVLYTRTTETWEEEKTLTVTVPAHNIIHVLSVLIHLQIHS